MIAQADKLDELINAFINQRGDHEHEQRAQRRFLLASYAAVSLLLTPDMLYRLVASPLLRKEPLSDPAHIAWRDVGDLLLSGLCRELEPGLYEVLPGIRKRLLQRAFDDERIGQERLARMAEFVLAYSEQHFAQRRELFVAQEWAAKAVLDTNWGAREIVNLIYQLGKQIAAPNDDEAALAAPALADVRSPSERAELARIAALAAELPDQPNSDHFRRLLLYLRSMARSSRNDLGGAVRVLENESFPIKALTLRIVFEGEPAEDDELPGELRLDLPANVISKRHAPPKIEATSPVADLLHVFDRTEKLYGNFDPETLLVQPLAVVRGEPLCRVVYIQGRGGLGKTRLLEECERLSEEVRGDLRMGHIIDFALLDNRKTLVLERELINGLRIGEFAVAAELMDKAFSPYERARASYERIYQYQPAERSAARQQLTNDFVEGWNRVSSDHPLLIRFDTLERLLNMRLLPDDSIVKMVEADASIYAIRSWLLDVLPRLQHTLVILAGRPSATPKFEEIRESDIDRADRSPNLFTENKLATDFQAAGCLDEETGWHILQPIRDIYDIQCYLAEYGMSVDEQEAIRVRDCTSGSPLFLTLYAAAYRLAPLLPWRRWLVSELANLTSPTVFQTLMVQEVLQPSFFRLTAKRREQLRNDQMLAQELRIEEKSTYDQELTTLFYVLDRLHLLTLSIAILADARRGLKNEHLSEVLQSLSSHQKITNELEEELAELLQKHVLVKDLSATLESTENKQVYWYLHDEMWLVIDESRFFEYLGLSKHILAKLEQLSHSQAQEILRRTTEAGWLRSLADHMYYAITNDFSEGYRYYLVYMDILFGRRAIDDAVALADTLWRMLGITGIHTEGPVQIYRKHLSDDKRLDMPLVRAFDRLHGAKLLLALGYNKEAVTQVQDIYAELLAAGALPPYEELSVATPPATPYLACDLLLTWANALLLFGTTEATRQASQLCEKLIELLQDTDALLEAVAELHARNPSLRSDDELLRLRRDYFLGIAYRTRSQLARQAQDLDAAIADAEKALVCLARYLSPLPNAATDDATPAPADRLNDLLREDRAYIENNLAYTLSEAGDLDSAINKSNRVIESYCRIKQPVGDYPQALFYNTNAHIYLLLDYLSAADEALVQADAAVERAQVARARGLVALTHARRARWAMNHVERNPLKEFGDRRHEAEEWYQLAEMFLKTEQASRREVLHDWARFLRDQAHWYRISGEPYISEATLQSAKTRITNALELTPESDTTLPLLADIYETYASIEVDLANYSSASDLLHQSNRLLESVFQGGQLPRHMQGLCAKLALQQGYLLLIDPERVDAQEALRCFALACAYASGHGSRTAQVVEDMVRRWVMAEKRTTPEVVSSFAADLEDFHWFRPLSSLPYQFKSVDERAWNKYWDATISFFGQLAKEYLDSEAANTS